MNLHVNSPQVSIFTNKSMDVSEVSKDANLLYNMLNAMVEEVVREENVFQVDLVIGSGTCPPRPAPTRKKQDQGRLNLTVTQPGPKVRGPEIY